MRSSLVFGLLIAIFVININPGSKSGEGGCNTGAGSVVTGDVPPFALAYGNPARLHGWASYCGGRLPLDTDDREETARCAACDREYERRGHAVVVRADHELSK